MTKKPLSFWKMFNLNFGYLGIQFGWGLQMANMSGIYKFLGASAADVPYLWIAAPLSGLIIQPLLGKLSDQTWCQWLGRRRPYILGGAIASSIAMFLMPNSIDIWMAASLLWVLDGSINITMQPFRALVADLAPENQLTTCYSIQTFLVGIGSTLSYALPWILLHLFHLESTASGNAIPLAIRVSFYIGATAFLLANLWTVFFSEEYPPEKVHQQKKQEVKQQRQKLLFNLSTIVVDFIKMPKIMRKISYIQFFTWMGMFCTYLYFGLGIAQNIFGLPLEADVTHNTLYQHLLEKGIALGGLCFAVYTFFSIFFSLLLPKSSKLIGKKGTHILCLVLGAIGLIATKYIHNTGYLIIAMIGMGAAWASIATMPYAMLAGSLPEEKMGVYMGLFNMAICVPEIIATLTLGFLVHYVFHYDAMSIIEMAGVFFLVAAFFTFFIHDKLIEAQ